ncbi:MAG: hypothetical protein GXO54_00975 [Chloroflexi bacterium]|nr:hypothetical protein [Chloroflexota bacterium]
MRERRLPNPGRAWRTIFLPLLVGAVLVLVAMVGVVRGTDATLARGAAVVVAYAALGLLLITTGILIALVYLNWKVWQAWPALAHQLWRWQRQAEAAPSMVRQIAYRTAQLIIAPRVTLARLRGTVRVLAQVLPRPRRGGGHK